MKHVVYDTMCRLIGSDRPPSKTEQNIADRLDEMHRDGWDLVVIEGTRYVFRPAPWWSQVWRYMAFERGGRT